MSASAILKSVIVSDPSPAANTKVSAPGQPAQRVITGQPDDQVVSSGAWNYELR